MAILTALGLPRGQRNERSALTLLALARLGPGDPWTAVDRPLLRIWDIMGFIRNSYGKDYAANSRETFRRHTIHQFEQARLVDRNPDSPDRPTNSGKTAYVLTPAAEGILKVYGTPDFGRAVGSFVEQFGTLQALYGRERDTHKVPLRLADGSVVLLSPGDHNALQVAIIEEFGSRFAPDAVVLYVGDTAKKHIVFDAEQLSRLGVPINYHDKLPDVVLHDPNRRWLFLIEAVTSHGPISPKRHREIELSLSDCRLERIYVTAFLDIGEFRKHAAEIAWETEVWIASTPSHMIHFNGTKFLGPHNPETSHAEPPRLPIAPPPGISPAEDEA